jgi:hypothetical protein
MTHGWGGKRVGAGRRPGSKNTPMPSLALNDASAPLLLSRRSAARVLGISIVKLKHAIAAGLLETRRVNSRVLIPTESARRFAASDQIIPGAHDINWGGRRTAAGRKVGSTKILAQAQALASFQKPPENISS